MEKVNDLKDIGKLSFGNNFTTNRDFKRGDIYYIKNFEGAVDSEQKGTRPAVIVSNNIGNKHSPNISIAYLTTAEKKNQLPTHVEINSAKEKSIVLCECIKEVSKSRVLEYIGKVTAGEMELINRALAISLGLVYEQKQDDLISDNELVIEVEKKKSEITDIQKRLIKFEKASNNDVINPDLLKVLDNETILSISSKVNEMIQADKSKIEVELQKAIGIFKEDKTVKDIEIFVDTKKVAEAIKEVKKEVVKEVDKPSEKVTSKHSDKKSKGYDVGKILALKRAGWKVKDIAEEFNVTPQVISNVLFKIKREQESKGAAI